MHIYIKIWFLYFISILFVIHSFSQIIFAREKVQDLEKFNIKWGMTKAEFMKNRPDIVIDMGQSILINVKYLGHKIKAELLFQRFPFKKYPDYLSLIMCNIGFKDINHQNVINTIKDFRKFNEHLTEVNGEPLNLTDPCLKKEDYNCYLTEVKKKNGFGALWEIDMTDINNNNITLEILNSVSILENKVNHYIHFMVH